MSGDALTFAEAMAVAVSEPVTIGTSRPMEVRHGILYFADEPDRMSLVPFKPEYLTASWRRIRSRRSRVQEMARDWQKPTITFDQVSAFGDAAIRAVCEWLRNESRLGFERNPDAIEREFLEPR